MSTGAGKSSHMLERSEALPVDCYGVLVLLVGLLSLVLDLLFLLLWGVPVGFALADREFFLFGGALCKFRILWEEQGCSLISSSLSLSDLQNLPVIFTAAGLEANRDCFICGVSIGVVSTLWEEQDYSTFPSTSFSLSHSFESLSVQ